MPLDIDSLSRQIQLNCNISDARYGSLFSVCGLLLRLRDLYKWEQDMPPWQEPEPSDLLTWIDAREGSWQDLCEHEFESLQMGSKQYSTFDCATINRQLQPSGLIYGAGYAAFMKPSFFLGQVVESRQIGTLQIHVVDRELARDLFVTPAMKQGDQIFARRSAMRFFLWDQIMEMRPSAKSALDFALMQYGRSLRVVRKTPGDHHDLLNHVAHQELDRWIYHEIGESQRSAFEGDVWHEIVAHFANSPIEIFARVLKDLLADTHPQGFLGHIIAGQHASSVGFYVAFMRPFTRILFPEIITALAEFRETGDWLVVERARQAGYEKVDGQAKALVSLYRKKAEQGQEWVRERIMEELIEPLEIG